MTFTAKATGIRTLPNKTTLKRFPSRSLGQHAVRSTAIARSLDFRFSVHNILRLDFSDDYTPIMSSFNAFSPFLRRAVPWTCRACARRQIVPPQPYRSAFATKANHATKPIAKNKRRRRLLIAGGGLTIGAALVTINDDAKHAYTAVQRSSRVATTLYLNIKE